MKKSSKIALIILVILLGVSGAAIAIAQNTSSDHGDKKYSWRYKMTVNVETPEGIKSGSAVREVKIHWKNIGWDEINQEPHYSEKIKIDGEAVVVDLGERGKLFVLANDKSYTDAINAFNIPKYADIEKLPAGSKAEFDTSKYPGSPMMVTFADLSDPKTVTAALIWSKNKQGQYVLKDNYMEKLFGPGVHLKNIEIEMTDDPVTWDIKSKKILPWLPDYYNQRLDGNRFGTIKSQNRFANSLASGAFSTGNDKNE